MKISTKYIHYGLLFIVAMLSLNVRTSNMKHLQGKYLLALDPYIFYRYSRHFVETGEMMETDTLRYYPEGFDVSRENLMPVYATLFLYYTMKFTGITGAAVGVPQVTESSIMLAAEIYPAVFGTLSVIVFYFLLNQFFKRRDIAITGAALLAFSGAYLYRTMAGFSEKEPGAMFFIFLALLTYAKAFESKKKWMALLSGIVAGLAGLSWGGHIYLVASICLSATIILFLRGPSKEENTVYMMWLAPYFLMMTFLTQRYGGMYFFKDIKFILTLFPISAYFVYSKLEKVKYGRLISVFSIILAVLVFSSIAMGPANAFKLMRTFFYDKISFSLGTDRFTTTIAENQVTTFRDWLGSYSYLTYLVFPGIILLFYDTFKSSKNRLYLLALFVLFCVDVVASRYDGDSNNFFTKNYYSVLIFTFAAMIFIFSLGRKLKVNMNYVLPLVLFCLLFVSVRGAMRLLFVFTPGIVLASSYFLVRVSDFIPSSLRNLRVISYFVIFYLVYVSYGSVSMAAKSMGPSTTGGRDEAYNWIRENTSPDAVFIHWWDYGYWMQYHANRTTVLDGGNYRHPYNVARNFFSARDMNTVWGVLEEYDRPDYFMVDSTDIGKFSAISRIAEDDLWFTYFGSAGESDDKSGMTGFSKFRIFTPHSYLRSNWGQPAAVLIGFNETDSGSPLYYFEDGQNSRMVPASCYCVNNKCADIGEGYPGCFAMTDKGIIYIPEEARGLFFTRIYILNEGIPGFEKVYDGGVGTRVTLYEISYDNL